MENWYDAVEYSGCFLASMLVSRQNVFLLVAFWTHKCLNSFKRVKLIYGSCEMTCFNLPLWVHHLIDGGNKFQIIGVKTNSP